MDLIPHEEIKPHLSFNFTPMVDFLFLMLTLFATLALSRSALFKEEIELVEHTPEAKKNTSLAFHEIQHINLCITEQGQYKWMTEFQEYPMESVQTIQEEIARQYQMGALAQDKSKTEVLLHIDEKAPWASIAHVIFAVREIGFQIHPVYKGQ